MSYSPARTAPQTCQSVGVGVCLFWGDGAVGRRRMVCVLTDRKSSVMVRYVRKDTSLHPSHHARQHLPRFRALAGQHHGAARAGGHIGVFPPMVGGEHPFVVGSEVLGFFALPVRLGVVWTGRECVYAFGRPSH